LQVDVPHTGIPGTDCAGCQADLTTDIVADVTYWNRKANAYHLELTHLRHNILTGPVRVVHYCSLCGEERGNVAPDETPDDARAAAIAHLNGCPGNPYLGEIAELKQELEKEQAGKWECEFCGLERAYPEYPKMAAKHLLECPDIGKYLVVKPKPKKK
jgi:hypothetical protein